MVKVAEETRKQRALYFKQMAARDYKDHRLTSVIETDEAKVYRCQKPNEWHLCFDVTFSQGCIFLSGDGPIFIIERKSLEWLLGAIREAYVSDYIISKASSLYRDDKVFLPDEVVPHLQELGEEHREFWGEQDNPYLAAIRDFKEMRDCSEEHKLYDATYEVLSQHIQDAWEDMECFLDYSNNTHWAYWALWRFVELYKSREGAAL
jgi:hypothetical protein